MKVLRTFTVVLALAAIVATTTLGAGSASAATFITDTLGGNGHPQHAAPVSGLITDTLGGNGGSAATTVLQSTPGFNWGDAGVGAATTFGSLLVLLGGSLVVVRRRSGLAL
jgi:hypothetical protein